jgi:thiamine biosynthesis lipoprotein
MNARLLLLLVSLLTGLQACEDKSSWYRADELLYHGIPVRVSFSPRNDELASEVWKYLRGIDDVFNIYRADSELGRINRTKERNHIAVSTQLARAIRLSKEVHGQTAGAFDPTVGRLVQLWKDAARRGEPPQTRELERALSSRGMEKVILEGNRLAFESPDIQLDLGGMVKGMAVDEAVRMLKAGGARAALVQVGGETAAFGITEKGRPHVIGLQHPRRLKRIWTSVSNPDPLKGLSISTSGNYRNPVVIGGKKYYHIVDPRTGQPVSDRVLSISVVFPDCGKNWLADALSTAFAVLGPDRAMPIAAKLGGQALFLLEVNGKIVERKSPGWDKLSPAVTRKRR